MKPLWQQRLHLGARALGWVAGIAVIALAVLLALAQLLLPLLARHPEWVARELSAKLHRPVSFASLQGKWTGSGPLFVLRDIRVGVPPGERGAPIEIPQSELRLDLAGWLPSRHLVNLRASGRNWISAAMRTAAGTSTASAPAPARAPNSRPASAGFRWRCGWTTCV